MKCRWIGQGGCEDADVIKASVEESRSWTIWSGLEKTIPDLDKEEICIHLLGCDFVEVSARPLDGFKVLYQILLENTTKVAKLTIVMIGPNVPRAASGSTISTTVGRLGVSMHFECNLYHESSCINDAKFRRADMAFLFDAGIWGYDSWKPTLIKLCENNDLPVVVTSYNEWEADDDHDSISSALEHNERLCWKWQPEKNPYGSLRHRPSGIEGRTCADNNYWQCFK
mmetsp:Transcript_9832/g.18470  ORF Transcript_9832/g.18470 Transcript_9832/m.18470 type:complete len:227 (-) Transcript_9832:1338-2018(-)